MAKRKIITTTKDLDASVLKDQEYLNHLLDQPNSIIRGILERTEFRKYNLYCFQSLIRQPSRKSQIKPSGGLGLSENRALALAKCISESVERYSLAAGTARGKSVVCTIDKLPEKLRPDANLFLPKTLNTKIQFVDPRKKPSKWYLLKAPGGGRSVYWPASKLFFVDRDTPRMTESTTTGVACHFKVNEAYLSGMLECIERDALMLHYRKGLRPPATNLLSLPRSTYGTYIEPLRKSRFIIRIYKLYSDVEVPVYLCYIWRKNRGGLRYGLGASAKLDAFEAVNKSLQEAIVSYFFAAKLAHKHIAAKSDITAFHDHFMYYQKDRFSQLYADDKNKTDFDHAQTSEQQLHHKLDQLGFNHFTIDQTADDVRAHSPLRVVRSIIPKLLDLNVMSDIITNESRYSSALSSLNIEPPIAGYNMRPHPFP